MLASLPLPAHAKGMVAMDIMSPFVAMASMSMMAILIAWQHLPQARKVEEQTLTAPVVVAAALQAARASSANDKEPGAGAELVEFFSAGMQGYRDYMEDYTVTVPALPNNPHAGLYGVFDGHGGFKVAELCAEKLPGILDSTLQKCASPEDALHEAFKMLDEELLELGAATVSKQTSSSVTLRDLWRRGSTNAFDFCGCTACITLVLKEANNTTRVLCANCGDSRAVLSKSGSAVDLSIDHNPEDPEEYNRITAAGGTVTEEGPCYRINYGLNLSRAFGDFGYKPQALPRDKYMVISVPEIQEITIDAADEFIAIGSDGIFNAMGSQDVVNYVRGDMQQGRALEDIIARNLQRCLGSYDNVSLCVLKFSDPPASRL